MTTVLHLVDASVPLDLLRTLGVLADANERIVSLGPPPRDIDFARAAEHVHVPLGIPALAARLRGNVADGADIIHAWSLGVLPFAARLAQAGERGRPKLAISLPATPTRGELAQIAKFSKARPQTIVPADACRAAMVAAGAAAEAIHVVPPPALPPQPALRQAARAELGLPADTFAFAVPAPLTRRAAHNYASWAFGILRQMKDGIAMIIPGAGPLLGGVVSFATYTGCGEETFFTEGRMSLAQVLAAADCAMFPNRHADGLATLAAAMAAGLPIVASRLPEFEELAGDTAAFFLPCDPQKCTREMLHVLDDRPAAQALGRRARARADQLYQPAAIRRRLDDVYQSILARGL